MKFTNTQILEKAIWASIEAGIKVNEIYQMDFEIAFKADKSPLTTADTASNEVIMRYLDPLQIPVLSEEGRSISYEERSRWQRLWIVDPLDGTKEFIKKNGEFTINVALVEKGSPIMGVIYIPVERSLYFASEETGSMKVMDITPADLNTSLDEFMMRGTKLPLKKADRVYTIVGSKSHLSPETEVFINSLKEKHGDVEVLSRGSSLKICMVAEGMADIYPRFAPTMEWDIAAGHAIAKYAGSRIIKTDSNDEVSYNKKDLLNPWFIVQ